MTANNNNNHPSLNVQNEMAGKKKNEPLQQNSPTSPPVVNSMGHHRRESRESVVSRTLGEVCSAHILATPHGVTLAFKPSNLSVNEFKPTMPYDIMSIASTHELEMMMLRKHTFEGIDVPVDFDDALNETGYGRFQYQLMALCGFIYSCCSLSTTTLSFVLPAAEEDFGLNSAKKGLLNTAPLFGMVLGSYFWGNFADSKGRKFVLVYALLMDAIAAFLSSLCQHYSVFFICRIFNGFGIIGATSMVFAYLGEFIDPQKRDRALARLELFWTAGIMALPAIGLAVLYNTWEIGNKWFVFTEWKLFVLVCGIPSLLCAFVMMRMPESPRFLLLQGKHHKAKEVLVHMYVTNTKDNPEKFPVKVLEESEEAKYYFFHQTDHASKWSIIKNRITGILQQHKQLFRKGDLYKILLTCYIDFGLMSSYFTIILWIPELMERQKNYQVLHPGQLATLCEVSHNLSDDHVSRGIDLDVFIHTLIICLACLPSTIILLYVMQCIPKNIILIVLLIISGLATLGLYFVNSTNQVITMCCIFEAFTTLVEAVLFCIIVEIFPTNTRGTALSLTVTIGRLGAVLGNIVFGVLIDKICIVPFALFVFFLISSGIMALFLPKTRTGH